MARYGESNAKDLIARFIDSIGIHDEQGVVPFVRSWPSIAGRDVAAHSQVLDIKNGALIVGVDHPAWLQRLHMDRDRIVARVKREFPTLGVRYLHMTVVDHLDPTVQPSVERSEEHGEPSSEAVDSEAPTAGKLPGTDDASIADDVPAAEDAPSADEDAAFQDQLMRLKEAIERKNPDQ